MWGIENGRPVLRVGVLGPLAVSRGADLDVAALGARVLLGLLAIQPGHPVSQEEVVDALWADGPPAAWRGSLHHYVWLVRRLLEPHRPRRTPGRTLVRTRGGYRLDLADDELDLLRFEALAGRARAADPAADAPQALELWTGALRCWRGPVLANLGPGLRQHPAAVAVSARRVAAALAHADLAIGLGRYDQAVTSLSAVAADEPLHERVHARLMLALAGDGRAAAALAVFTALRARLADELGVEPADEVRQAHLRVLRHAVPPPGRAPDRTAELAELDALLRAGERCYAAGTLTHLGDAYHAAGNPAAARRAWRQALAILDRVTGDPDVPECA